MIRQRKFNLIFGVLLISVLLAPTVAAAFDPGNFSDLRQQYQSSPASVSEDSLVNSGRSHFASAVEGMSNYLNTAKQAVRDSSLPQDTKNRLVSDIENKISRLTAQKQQVSQAATLQELRSVASEVKDDWKKRRVEARKWSCQLLYSKTIDVITRLDSAASNLTATIEQLKEEGQNVSKLEAALVNFRGYLNLAQEKIEIAKSACADFDNLPSPAAAREEFIKVRGYVREAKSYLQKAHQELQTIVKELKNFKHQIKKVSGTGGVQLQGSGKAAFTGQGTIEGSIEPAGKLTVIDQAGDSQVETNSEAVVTTTNANKAVYSNLTSFTIAGSDLTVVVEGNNTTVSAQGTGKALFKGNGSYQTGLKTAAIPTGGIEVNLQN